MFSAITIAVNIPDAFKFLHTNCKQKGIELIPLGIDATRAFCYQGDMPYYLYNYCKTRHPDELLLYMDCIDSMIVGSKDEIYQKWSAYNSPLVFSAELYYAHCSMPIESMPIRTTFPYKYLNSGVWMGYAGEIVKYCEKYDFANIVTKHAADQGFWHEVYMQESDLILDHGAELFQNYECSDVAHEDHCFYDTEINQDFSYRDRRLFNNLTGSCAPIIHFPGGYQRRNTIIRKLIESPQSCQPAEASTDPTLSNKIVDSHS